MFKKPTFKSFIFYTLISNIAIYLLYFFLNKEKIDYFICTEIKIYNFKILSKNFELIYPESCDLNTYVEGIVNIQNFYNLSEYVYFDRPLFILFISIFFIILKIILLPYAVNTLFIIKASFFIGQIVLTSIVCLYICKIFQLVNININKMHFTLPWMISISPMFKWHIFESTSMTFTFFIFIFGIYLVLNFNDINYKYQFFIAGLLFLVHRSAVLIFIFTLLFAIIKKMLNYKVFSSSLFFFLPITVHYLILIFYTGFADHQAEGYRQFIWIIDYFQGKSTKTEGYFCQEPWLALLCYLNDIKNLIIYLFIPVIYLVINFLYSSKAKFLIYKKLIVSSLTFAILINLFWLFIGWYPPIRFSYYGLGNLIIFFLILSFALIENKNSKSLFFVAYTLYFLYLNHWNYHEVITRNNLLLISFFLFIFSIILDSNSSNKIFTIKR